MAVKLEPELRDRLRALGAARKRSPHWLMREAILRFVEHEEEAERGRVEALERLARFEESGEAVADRDVDAWLRSWGRKKELPATTRSRARSR